MSWLPVWPGWHRMPPPFEVRWSFKAWEAMYGKPWERGHKPWPHEEPRAVVPCPPGFDWMAAVREAFERAKRPGLSWEQFRTIMEAHEAAEPVWMHGTLNA
jgi:hypothetical protein